jgi:hypothetical protein
MASLSFMAPPTRPFAETLSFAQALRGNGLATLLVDLLTVDEARDRRDVFDIELLARRRRPPASSCEPRPRKRPGTTGSASRAGWRTAGGCASARPPARHRTGSPRRGYGPVGAHLTAEARIRPTEQVSVHDGAVGEADYFFDAPAKEAGEPAVAAAADDDRIGLPAPGCCHDLLGGFAERRLGRNPQAPLACAFLRVSSSMPSAVARANLIVAGGLVLARIVTLATSEPDDAFLELDRRIGVELFACRSARRR